MWISMTVFLIIVIIVLLLATSGPSHAAPDVPSAASAAAPLLAGCPGSVVRKLLNPRTTEPQWAVVAAAGAEDSEEPTAQWSIPRNGPIGP